MKTRSNLTDPITDEQRFQLLVAGVRDYAIYMLTPEGYVRSWNAGAQRFKGYAAHEIIGQHFSCFYTPEDKAAGIPATALQTALNEGKFEAEGWRIRKDGTRFWASVVIDPIRDDAGHLIGFAKITRDITERRAAQEALRESEERFRLLVQGVTDYAIFMISPAGKISNWNIGAERMKGYARAEIIGQHFSQFYTAEDRARGLPELALAAAVKEGRFEQEGLRVRKDGTTFWANAIIDTIRNDKGQLIGFAKITRDITEKRKAAEALDLANRALFQAQKMQALGQLTGGVAHDFNNILGVVASGMDLIAAHTDHRDALKVLDGIQRAVQRGSALTQQLLSFARQQPLTMEAHNLSKLITGFESVFRRAANSTIAFQLKLEPNLHTVLIDVARLETSLLNLIANALEAMPNGGALTIITENVDLAEHEVGSLAAGSYVKVSVADTGTGMTPEVASRAFEPFFTTKGTGQGAGLGLSQVYGFTAQSEGELVLKSEVGKGTTVSLYLPAIIGEPKDMEPEARVEKVLVVEDEPDLLNIAADLFRSIGYEVFTANNAAHAIEVLARERDIGILFTDVIMPNGVSGIELARVTRHLHPQMKIILTSGYPLPALRQAHGNLDEYIFISKPYRLMDLAKTLRKAG